MTRSPLKLVVAAMLFLGACWIEAQAGETSVIMSPLPVADVKESDRGLLQPTPELSPAEVVRIQIEALGEADVPYANAGIEVAFRFASPANKSTTGPLKRFIQLVRNPVYRPMLNHRHAEYGEIHLEGNRAVQLVILTGRDGGRTTYFFSLSKQKSGRYASCWMTDAVIRFEIPDGQDEALPI